MGYSKHFYFTKLYRVSVVFDVIFSQNSKIIYAAAYTYMHIMYMSHLLIPAFRDH